MSKSVVQSQVFSAVAQSKPIGVRAGDFLFLSGQTPHDPETGKLVTTLQDIRERAKGIVDLSEYEALWDRISFGPMVAQAFTILANIKAILSENGMSLEHVVKSNIYITNFQDLRFFYKIWRIFFPKPTAACTVIRMSTTGMHPKIRVIIDCIAALPEKIPLKDIQRFPSDSRQVGFGGCSAVKAGDLIFISGHVGVNDEGQAILKCREVGKEAQSLIETMPMATTRNEATVAQVWTIYKRINDLLKKVGSSGDNILLLHSSDRIDRDLSIIHPLRKIFFPKTPPAGSGFGYTSILGDDDLYVQFEAIAAVPGKKEAFNFESGLQVPTTHYSMVTKAGRYMFIAGRAGINWQRNGDPVVSVDDLVPWNGQHLMVGRVEQEKPVFLQAWYIYQAIEKIVKQMGATLDDVVKANIFLTDAGDLPLVERARNYFFKNTLPVETIIPVWQATMYRELVLEIEPYIVTDK